MTDTASLEDGFYWVRLWDDEWVIRERQCGDWYLPSTKIDIDKNDLIEIDPRPIKREDVK